MRSSPYSSMSGAIVALIWILAGSYVLVVSPIARTSTAQQLAVAALAVSGIVAAWSAAWVARRAARLSSGQRVLLSVIAGTFIGFVALLICGALIEVGAVWYLGHSLTGY
jgi:hypothetical protein